MIKQIFCSLVALLTLSGCKDRASASKERQAIFRYALEASPSDTVTTELYQRSCQSCHAKSLGGAPLPGDSATWLNLLKTRGMDGLVENIINGFRGMPPMGNCMDCDRENFEDLIRFMMKPHDDND